jgi:hypothetical protein
MTTRQQVLRLAMENPQWLRALEVSCDVATENRTWEQFAGTDVMQRLRREGRLEVPNLTPLVSYGLLERVGGARGGKRAYYSMPDIEGVREALAEADKGTLRWTKRGTASTSGFRATYGSTGPRGQVHWAVYTDDALDPSADEALDILIDEGDAPSEASAKEKCREVIVVARALQR